MSFLTCLVFKIAYYAATIGKLLPLTQVTPPTRLTSPIKKAEWKSCGSFTSSFSASSPFWRVPSSSLSRPCNLLFYSD